ncbi:MAG: amidohydrolase [Lachnospiraceae bacterium]
MKADTIYWNGQVVTMNSKDETVQAVAVKGNCILGAGSNEEMQVFRSEETRMVDLQGKMMLPGFIDSHCHPVLAALFLGGLVIDFNESKEEILAHLKEYVETHPEQEQYYGFGYKEILFGAEGPRKELLDAVCPDKPVLLQSSGGHEAWCNSCCLEKAGVDADTPDPNPGLQYYQRDEEGNPTGHCIEMKTIMYLYEHAGFLEGFDTEGIMSDFSKGYAKLGITSMVDCGFPEGMFDKRKTLETIQKLFREERLMQRWFGPACFLTEREEFEGDMSVLLDKWVQEKEIYDTDMLRCDFVKIVDDGTFESRNAANFEPYVLDGLKVEPLLRTEELTEFALLTAQKGLDLHVHGIGDQTIHDILMAAKAVREAGYDDMRITIAHTELVRPEDVPLFAQYNVTANTSGVWHYGQPQREDDLGEQIHRVFRMMDIKREGGRVTMSSDHPASEYGNNPLGGVEVAYTRRTLGRPETPYLGTTEDSMPILESLRGYTIDAAYQVHMEDKLGSIEAGKYADLVVLEQNPYEIDPYKIHEIDVAMTIMDGKVVYRNKMDTISE